MEFKDIFSELRKERNYSQRKIADMLSVSNSTVAMWETGQRKQFPMCDALPECGMILLPILILRIKR